MFVFLLQFTLFRSLLHTCETIAVLCAWACVHLFNRFCYNCLFARLQQQRRRRRSFRHRCNTIYYIKISVLLFYQCSHTHMHAYLCLLFFPFLPFYSIPFEITFFFSAHIRSLFLSRQSFGDHCATTYAIACSSLLFCMFFISLSLFNCYK